MNEKLSFRQTLLIGSLLFGGYIGLKEPLRRT